MIDVECKSFSYILLFSWLMGLICGFSMIKTTISANAIAKISKEELKQWIFEHWHIIPWCHHSFHIFIESIQTPLVACQMSPE